MEYSAIYHLMDSQYSHCLDEQTVLIRLKAKRGDLKECVLFYGDRAFPRNPVQMTGIKMPKVASGMFHDYFEIRLKPPFKRLCYYFWLSDGIESAYFYNNTFSQTDNVNRTRFFQVPFMHRSDLVTYPAWAENRVMYQIFPDSFADSMKGISSAAGQKDFNGQASQRRHGGTIKGITENLAYLEELGINCLYLNPIFAASSYHKYDTIDYYSVDPCFGTNGDLKELVSQCHTRDIKVILDGVFNHCGSGFFAFRDVLEKGEDSQYCSWFYNLEFPVSFSDPPNFDCFAYVKEMPKLNTACPEVIDYFCKVGAYWIEEAGIDGWRLDVANEVNHDFWREFRRAVKKVRSDILLIGEIWEDARSHLQGDQFDSTMNYTFTDICCLFFAEDKITLDLFDRKIHDMLMRYKVPISRIQMNFLNTHDVARFIHLCGGNMSRLKTAAFYLLTSPGIPSVFYGDEKGLSGVDENESRKPMLWEDTDESASLTGYYALLIKLRFRYSKAFNGDYRTFYKDECSRVYVYERSSGSEVVYCGFNTSWREQTVRLVLPWENLFDPLTGSAYGPSEDGVYNISVKSWEPLMLVPGDGSFKQ